MIRLHTNGVADWSVRFLQTQQLKDRVLWAEFVDLFRSRPDAQNHGWRGEYWGKMMRGAGLVLRSENGYKAKFRFLTIICCGDTLVI